MDKEDVNVEEKHENRDMIRLKFEGGIIYFFVVLWIAMRLWLRLYAGYPPPTLVPINIKSKC